MVSESSCFKKIHLRQLQRQRFWFEIFATNLCLPCSRNFDTARCHEGRARVFEIFAENMCLLVWFAKSSPTELEWLECFASLAEGAPRPLHCGVWSGRCQTETPLAISCTGYVGTAWFLLRLLCHGSKAQNVQVLHSEQIWQRLKGYQCLLWAHFAAPLDIFHRFDGETQLAQWFGRTPETFLSRARGNARQGCATQPHPCAGRGFFDCFK